MAAFEIPTAGAPFSFTISMNGVTYGMTLKWNNAAAVWVLDIYDANNVLIIAGIPLITGADLLAQFEYLGIGGIMAATTDHDATAPPTFFNIGQTGHLYFQPS